jgi:preprotein translocase subunit SecD
MLHVARWRTIAVIVVTLFGILFALPNVLPANVRSAMPNLLPKNTVNLGLDLQGGSHLLFEVQTEAVFAERLDTLSDDMARVLNETPRIAYTGRGVSGDAARINVSDPAQLAEAQKRIEALGQPVSNAFGQTAASDIAVTTTPQGAIAVSLVEEAKVQLTSSAVQQSIEVIRRRIDETGTREPTIVRQGRDRIVVQAPGESDPERLKALIGQTAKLSFQMVDPSVTPQEAAAGRVPPGAVLLPSEEPSEPAVVVRRRVIVSGENLVDAQPGFDSRTGEAVVNFRFDNRGGRAFGRASQENVGQRFAIILDNKVISAPVIREAILGGSGQISGNFTVESANDLALLLRAGALPAPLTVLEQRTVGPELGQDAINAGAIAGIIAMALVVAFMMLAYGVIFGGIAILALTINLVLIFAGMSIVGATLTLPGIAGLILTIGAAVDANVLIYERMREERLAGRSVALALDAGFQRAIVTIMDANVTALLTALILFWFGAGPVRGFAWTLSIGVLTSVFTAVLVTQVLLAWWYWSRKPKELPI